MRLTGKVPELRVLYTPSYWQRRIMEAIQIKTNGGVMNFDSSMQLPTVCNLALIPP